MKLILTISFLPLVFVIHFILIALTGQTQDYIAWMATWNFSIGYMIGLWLLVGGLLVAMYWGRKGKVS